MEKDDLISKLLTHIPLDSPSDDFTERVMANIIPVTETIPVKRSFYFYLRASFPYILVLLTLILVVSTSDLPFLNWLPGKAYFLDTLVPYLGSLFAGLKTAFATKYVSMGILIGCSVGVLFLIDRVMSRRSAL